MDEVGIRWALIEAIASGPLAWAEARALARAVGIPVDLVEVHLAALLVEGWVDDWTLPWGAVVVTLTPWAAEVLGLALDDRGRDELPHWTAERAELDSRPVRIAEPDLTKTDARAALKGRPPHRCWFLRLDPDPIEVD